ncbi:hypothetical protein L210DRAFT_3641111 [Boletus edulis BED1]|uniref:Uncharacterized protein n=1 Tax=Boletus edulis BED1 TaxID=1328754 RepID=A0AAD4GKS4_BOLED|nr:hypothetical protein L210DRAFT_3641111 [Boletus edulis BED1]
MPESDPTTKPPKRVIKLSEKAKLGLEDQNPKRRKGDDLNNTSANPLKKARTALPGAQAASKSSKGSHTEGEGSSGNDNGNADANNGSQRDPTNLEPELEDMDIEIIDSPEQQLHAHLMKEWTSPIYAFFEPKPLVEEQNGCCSHLFKCASRSCKTTIWRYLDTKDARSTGNMRKHARKCWGDEPVSAADDAKDANEARTKVVGGILKNGKITQLFERKGKE